MWEWRAFIPYTASAGAGGSPTAPLFDVFAALGLRVTGQGERRSDVYFAPTTAAVGLKCRHATSLELKVVRKTKPEFPGLAKWEKHARLAWDGRVASLGAVVRSVRADDDSVQAAQLAATAALLEQGGKAVRVWVHKTRHQCRHGGVVVEQTECVLECGGDGDGDDRAPAGSVRTVCVEGKKKAVWEVVRALDLPPVAQVVHYPEFVNTVAATARPSE